MGTVTNTLIDGAGRGLRNVTVRILLIAPLNPFLLNGTGEILSRVAVDTDQNGVWSVDLVPSSQLDQTNAYYLVDESQAPGGRRWAIVVPDGAGPFNLRDLLVPTPPTTDPNGPSPVRNASFHWEQVNPVSIWTIPHNLGFYPNLRIKDTAGADWYGWSVTDVSVNSLTVDLGVSMAGTAELS
jgi:hypothetical protein